MLLNQCYYVATATFQRQEQISALFKFLAISLCFSLHDLLCQEETKYSYSTSLNEFPSTLFSKPLPSIFTLLKSTTYTADNLDEAGFLVLCNDKSY